MTESTGCPRCNAPLQARPGRTIACSACHGVFVARDDLASVVQSLVAGQVAVELGDAYRAAPVREQVGTAGIETGVRYLPCPVCGKSMNRKRLIKRLDLTVDICLAHGVWFDAGELHRVAQDMGPDDGTTRKIDLGVMGRVSGIPPSRNGGES